MTNYYEKYIEPVLNELPVEARNYILNNFSVQEYLRDIKKNTFLKKKHEKNQITVSTLYWHISKLYTNTEFMDSFNNFGNASFVPEPLDSEYTTACKKIDSKNGKLTTPKRFHSIYEVKSSPTHGYVCRIRGTQAHKAFNVIPNHGEKNSVINAINKLTTVPLLSIDDRLELFKYLAKHARIKYIASNIVRRTHGSQYDVNEINSEHNKHNLILKIQNKIHVLNSERDAILTDIDNQIKDLQQQQEVLVTDVQQNEENTDYKKNQEAALKVLNSTQRCEHLTRKKEQITQKYMNRIEFLKQISGLPFTKLREMQAEKQK